MDPIKDRAAKLGKAVDEAVDTAFMRCGDRLKRIEIDIVDDQARLLEKFRHDMSDVYTKLIQQVGRFVEYYASDLLIDIDSMSRSMLDVAKGDADSVLCVFGLRESGVDHLAYVKCQMSSYLHNSSCFGNYYRKIYAVRIMLRKLPEESENPAGKLVVEFKEINKELSHELWRLGNEF